LIWEKPRNAAFSHYIVDSVRGITSGTAPFLSSDSTSQEQNANWFNAPGSSSISFNSNDWGTSTTLVDWIWRAGGTPAVTNTDGTITSTVSANTSSGFSVVTFTGNGTSSQTVGHGLGVTPTFFILKSRGTQVWNVYSLAGGITGNTILQLNDSSGAVTGSNISLTASSTTIGFGSASQVNGSGVNFVAYCFAPVAGYSAFGSYTGNGSNDGPFIFTGFRPRWLFVKKSSGESNWQCLDTSRSPYNLAGEDLLFNASDAEKTIAQGFNHADILSNGFKLRNTNCNDSGGTYIYMAFAENPFKYANAR